MHQERTNKHANDDAVPDGAIPAYLLDREGVSRAKVLSNTVKQKRKEKAGKWDVPIPKVYAILWSFDCRRKRWETKLFVSEGIILPAVLGIVCVMFNGMLYAEG